MIPLRGDGGRLPAYEVCNFMFRNLLGGALVCIIGIGVFLTGCQSDAGTAALVGGAGGAAVGAAIGSVSHARAGEGALIGAAVGALGGAIVGDAIERADQRAAQQRYAASVPEPVTKADVVCWTQRGMSDEEIIDRIERSGTIFHLSAADENYLRDKGVSPTVIQVMQGTSRR